MNKAPVVEVKVGQVWQDNDKRMSERYLRVVRIDNNRWPVAVCVCQLCSAFGDLIDGRLSSIAIKRMKPTSTGYRLHIDVEAKG